MLTNKLITEAEVEDYKVENWLPLYETLIETLHLLAAQGGTQEARKRALRETLKSQLRELGYMERVWEIETPPHSNVNRGLESQTSESNVISASSLNCEPCDNGSCPPCFQ